MDRSVLSLGIETATRGGSVILLRDTAVIGSRLGQPDVSHSNTLLSDIDAVLSEAGVALKEIDLFACASGPGSFTGLRIGIATLKALANSTAKPSIGIPTLTAIAHSAGSSERTVALLPAGRGEVFAQMFSVEADGTIFELDMPAHIAPAKLLEKYGSHANITWAGSGSHAQLEFLKANAGLRGYSFVEGKRNDESQSCWRIAAEPENLAKHVAIIALQQFNAGRASTADSLSAIYVRPSDAELKQQQNAAN